MKRRGPAILLAVAIAGCAAQPAPHALTQDSSTVQFASRENHVRFSYPKTWHPVTDDTILSLVPTGETSLGDHRLVIDIPDLPFHIPGLIPMGLVVRGFEDDLKKRYKDVTLAPVADRQVGGVAGQELNAHARGDHGDVVVRAVLFVEGDRVYFIDAESDTTGAAAASKAFETVADSFQWMD